MDKKTIQPGTNPALKTNDKIFTKSRAIRRVKQTNISLPKAKID